MIRGGIIHDGVRADCDADHSVSFAPLTKNRSRTPGGDSNLAAFGFVCFLTGRSTGEELLKENPAHKVLAVFASMAGHQGVVCVDARKGR